MPGPDSSVTIIGASGALGFGLAVRLAGAGVEVTIGSRDAERAAESAAKVLEHVPGAAVNGLLNAQAAAANELVVLSVPFRSHHETLAHIAEGMRAGQLLVDATVPLAASVGGKATRMLGVWQGSAAQQAQELVPDGVARRRRAAHGQRGDPRRPRARARRGRPADRRPPRRQGSASPALIDRIPGLRCVDAGRLEMARITESLTALMIAMNIRHKTHAGIRVTGLPDTLW